MGLKYCWQNSIKYFYYYLLLKLIQSHTAIQCIHIFSRPYCCPLQTFNCVQMSYSFNCITCGCHIYMSSNIVLICRHWLTRLALARSGGGSIRYVDVIYASFTTFGGEQLHEILVLFKKFLHNFCGSCCSGWFCIFRRDTFFHI